MQTGVEGVVVTVSRNGFARDGFQERDREKNAKQQTLAVFSKEIGLQYCVNLDGRQAGDWIRVVPLWEKMENSFADLHVQCHLIGDVPNRCEIARHIDENATPSCYYSGSGIILHIHVTDPDEYGKIYSSLLIWHDYMGLVSHFIVGTTKYMQLQVVTFKAKSMSESRHCSFHAVNVQPVGQVRFQHLRFSTAKVAVHDGIMYARCENGDKVLLLCPYEQSLLKATTESGLELDEEMYILYYQIQTRKGTIHISPFYFQDDEEAAWDTQMENLRDSCRACNEEDAMALKPSKSELSQHEFKEHWLRHYKNFWNPEEDELNWQSFFNIEDGSMTNDKLTPAGKSNRYSENLSDAEEAVIVPDGENALESSTSVESSDSLSKRCLQLSVSQQALESESEEQENKENVHIFNRPSSESESDETDSWNFSGNVMNNEKVLPSNETSFAVENNLMATHISAFDGLNVSDDTISLSSNSGEDLDLSADSDSEYEEVAVITPVRLVENTPDAEINIEHRKIENLVDEEDEEDAMVRNLKQYFESSQQTVPKPPKQSELEVQKEAVEKPDNEEELMHLERVCRERTEALQARITELCAIELIPMSRRGSVSVDSSIDFPIHEVGSTSSAVNLSAEGIVLGPAAKLSTNTAGVGPAEQISRIEDPSISHVPAVSPPPEDPPTFSGSAPLPHLEDPLSCILITTFSREGVISTAAKEVLPSETSLLVNDMSKDISDLGAPPQSRRVGSVFSKRRPLSQASSSPSELVPPTRSSQSSPCELAPHPKALRMVSRDDGETISDYLDRILGKFDDVLSRTLRFVLNMIMENKRLLSYIKQYYRCLFDLLTQMYKFPDYVCILDAERLNITGSQHSSSGSPQIDRISMENIIFQYILREKELWFEIKKQIDVAEDMINPFKARILT